jgi:hypothetical protein
LEVEKNSDECKSCAQNHYLKVNNGNCLQDPVNCNKCLPYTNTTGCDEMSKNDDVCDICNSDFYFDENDKTCVQRENKHCSTSKKNEDKCTSCVSNFYLTPENGKCVGITSVGYCFKYNSPANKCSECHENFFLDSNNNKCIPNPDGIAGCEKYKSRTICEICKDEMYLEGKKCIRNDIKVDGCAKYESEGVCKKCKSSHLMTQNGCQMKINTSCALWKDINNCASCPASMVLKNVDNKETCVSISIYYCEVAVMNGEVENCMKCEGKLIPSEDKQSCISITKEITDCLTYDPTSSPDTPKCEKCINKRVLSKTKEQCIDSPGIKSGSCVHGKEFFENKCVHCQPGYQFDGEQCVICGGEGCLACDITNPEKCFVCLPKYTMSIFGVCKQTFVDDVGGMVFLWNFMYVLMVNVLFMVN